MNIFRASALAALIASAAALMPAFIAYADDAADFTSDVGQARQELDQNVSDQSYQTAVVDGEDQSAASVTSEGTTDETPVFATPDEADANIQNAGEAGPSVLDTSETVDVTDANDLTPQSLDVVSSQESEDQSNQTEAGVNEQDQGSVDSSSGGDQGSVDQGQTDQSQVEEGQTQTDQSQQDQESQSVAPSDQGSAPSDQQPQ